MHRRAVTAGRVSDARNRNLKSILADDRAEDEEVFTREINMGNELEDIIRHLVRLVRKYLWRL